MHIEVAYAQPANQLIIGLDVAEGTTVQEAIQHSGILEKFPEIDLTVNKVGVFGKLTTLDQLLREGDRVEIYRKLIADPKLARRQKAKAEKNSEN